MWQSPDSWGRDMRVYPSAPAAGGPSSDQSEHGDREAGYRPGGWAPPAGTHRDKAARRGGGENVEWLNHRNPSCVLCSSRWIVDGRFCCLAPADRRVQSMNPSCDSRATTAAVPLGHGPGPDRPRVGRTGFLAGGRVERAPGSGLGASLPASDGASDDRTLCAEPRAGATGWPPR